MKPLEKLINQFGKETEKKRQAESKIKLPKRKVKSNCRSGKKKNQKKLGNKREAEKGVMFEKFERQIIGEENADDNLIYTYRIMSMREGSNKI